MFRVVDDHSLIHWVGPFVQNVWNPDRKNLVFAWNWGSRGEGKEEPMSRLHRREIVEILESQ